jgi:hypothetical protein
METGNYGLKMTIHLILGYQGSGKTLYMVLKAWEYYKKGYKIYSNIAFKGIPYEEISLNAVINCEYSHAVVFIDEIHLLLPSRNSLARNSRLICDGFLSMVRKKKLEIFGSCQTPRKVDIRFREEADLIYTCTKYAYYNGNWENIQHSQDLDKDIPIMIKVQILDMVSNNSLDLKFYANPLFKLYDTEQIVKIIDDIPKKEKVKK